MTGFLTSVKARCDELDDGPERLERARHPLATPAWATLMIGRLVWSSTSSHRRHDDRIGNRDE